jgi:hypothetical protein
MKRLHLAPALAAAAVILVIGLFGAVGFARKAGQLDTRDPAIIISTPTPTAQRTIAYFNLYDDRTAVAIDTRDIIGEVNAVDGWRLVLLRGGGRVWLPESEVQP